MNKIEFVKEKIPFTQVANGVLTDKRLSAKAKGLYAYLYSKPDGWDFSVERMCLEMSDGIESINTGLQELEKCGFLTRKRQADGRMFYMVHFPPLYPKGEKQLLGQEVKAKRRKTLPGEIASISNKDESNNKEERKKELPDSKAAGSNHKDIFEYYQNKVKELCGAVPVFNGGKDGLAVKRALSKFEPSEVKKIIDFYLFDSEKVKKFGYNLSITLSADTMNNYLYAAKRY
jgi:hypothetical protein